MNELVVKPANVTPAIVEVPGVDELEQYVDGMLATYKKTPVSAATLAQAKQARTDLNKAYKGLVINFGRSWICGWNVYITRYF